MFEGPAKHSLTSHSRCPLAIATVRSPSAGVVPRKAVVPLPKQAGEGGGAAGKEGEKASQEEEAKPGQATPCILHMDSIKGEAGAAALLTCAAEQSVTHASSVRWVPSHQGPRVGLPLPLLGLGDVCRSIAAPPCQRAVTEPCQLGGFPLPLQAGSHRINHFANKLRLYLEFEWDLKVRFGWGCGVWLGWVGGGWGRGAVQKVSRLAGLADPVCRGLPGRSIPRCAVLHLHRCPHRLPALGAALPHAGVARATRLGAGALGRGEPGAQAALVQLRLPRPLAQGQRLPARPCRASAPLCGAHARQPPSSRHIVVTHSSKRRAACVPHPLPAHVRDARCLQAF